MYEGNNPITYREVEGLKADKHAVYELYEEVDEEVDLRFEEGPDSSPVPIARLLLNLLSSVLDTIDFFRWREVRIYQLCSSFGRQDLALCGDILSINFGVF